MIFDGDEKMKELDDSLIITCSNCEWEIDPLNYCIKNGKIICHRCTECRPI